MIGRWIRSSIAVALLACFVVAQPSPCASAPRNAPASTLSVFAAASLADAFGELAHQFESTHAGTRVQLNLAGSQQLAVQMEQGAQADVYASADTRWMDYAREHGLVADSGSVFARNRLVVIVPRSNPARIGRLQDLARRGVKLVIGAEAVPVGKYSHEMFANLGHTDGFSPDFPKRVLANVVSEEENVKAVASKVQLGEADAGVVYRSDINPSLARFVRILEIPVAANVLATYPIAVAKGARNSDDARAFIELLLSPEGQRVLQRRGLVAVVELPAR